MIYVSKLRIQSPKQLAKISQMVQAKKRVSWIIYTSRLIDVRFSLHCGGVE